MNIVYLGKYEISDNFKNAGGKRVFNQASYLLNKNKVMIITFQNTNQAFFSQKYICK